jgi:hypothetical protein
MRRSSREVDLTQTAGRDGRDCTPSRSILLERPLSCDLAGILGAFVGPVGFEPYDQAFMSRRKHLETSGARCDIMIGRLGPSASPRRVSFRVDATCLGLLHLHTC